MAELPLTDDETLLLLWWSREWSAEVDAEPLLLLLEMLLLWSESERLLLLSRVWLLLCSERLLLLLETSSPGSQIPGMGFAFK